MKTYIKALLKCKVKTGIDEPWLKLFTLINKIGLSKRYTKAYTDWWLASYNWHSDMDKDMLSQARVFIGYDGALECQGRDTDEFLNEVQRGMDESIQYWSGVVAPRVQMNICFEDPERFPYHYVKWTTLMKLYYFKTHLIKHEPWIWVAIVLLSVNILTIL